MSKYINAFYTLIALIITRFLFSIVLNQSKNVKLPQYLIWLNSKYRISNFWYKFITNYLFWSALIILFIILISLPVIWFYPRTSTEILLKDEKGKLIITKSSLEGFVKSLVENEKIMKNTNISSKLYKNRFKIFIKGKIIPRIEISEKILLLKHQIEKELNEFFGINQKIDFKVIVTDTNKTSSKFKNRVK